MKTLSSLNFSTKLKIEDSTLFIVLVFLFYLIVAYKSSGFIHPDEHYKIIEFANYKLGLLPANKLAREFKAGARSGLQPLMCFIIHKLFHSTGVTDGYTLAFVLRVLTASFSIFVITQFVGTYKALIAKSLQPLYILHPTCLRFCHTLMLGFPPKPGRDYFYYCP